MNNPNKHLLTEVLCAVWFDQNQPWDSTYFGIYFEKIRDLGFTNKQEQKGYQILIDPTKSNPNSQFVPPELESKFIFKNESKNRAIILARNYISFHQLAPYENWQTLINEIAMPGLDYYDKLGIGLNIIQVQSLYLNQYSLNLNENIGDYLNFLPNLDSTSIQENITFLSTYGIYPNKQLFLNVNGNINQSFEINNIILQCGCIVKKVEPSNFQSLAEEAHKESVKLYNSIIK